MKKFQPEVILCPTDFSETATFALQYANFLARPFAGRLIVLYAEPFEPPPYFTSAQGNDLVKSLERSRKAAGAHLARYVQANLGKEVAAESSVLDSPPVPAILNTAEKRNADLIVLGRHGHSGWNKVMLGSVTEGVLRQTDRPVLTVHKKDSAAPVALRQILCPVNYTDVALLALEHAAALAETFSAALHVLNVIETPEEKTPKEATDRLCAWIPARIRPDCEMKEIVRQGNAAEQILEFAASAGCDLIVLGAQHKRFFDTTVIGSTTMRVTRHAPCPVLTIVRK